MKKILGIVAGIVGIISVIVGVYSWQGKGEKTSPFLRGQKCAINCIDNISPL